MLYVWASVLNQDNHGQLYIRLTDPSQRRFSSAEAADSIREILAEPAYQDLRAQVVIPSVLGSSVDYGTIRPAAECQLLLAGTSMSTPVVAGAAALILAVNPSYRVPALMKQLLCQTSEDIGDAKEGCGRLNVYRAMARALGDTIPPAARFRKP